MLPAIVPLCCSRCVTGPDLSSKNCHCDCVPLLLRPVQLHYSHSNIILQTRIFAPPTIASPDAIMTHLLHLHARFPPDQLLSTLSLRAQRTHSPPQWNWGWPLSAPPPLATNTNPHSWLSAIRAIALALSPHANLIAFVSQHGTLALCTSTPSRQLLPITIPDPSLCRNPISVALFTTTQSLLAVGYSSGAVAIFSTQSQAPIFTSLILQDLPVHRLRFNNDLYALLGPTGTVARLSTTSLPSGTHPFGAGWHIWHTKHRALDAAPVGTQPNSITFPDPQHAPLRMLTVGVDPPLATHAMSDDAAFTATAVAKRAANSVLTVARGLFRLADAPEPERAVVRSTRRNITWDDSTNANIINLSDVRHTARSVASALTRRQTALPERSNTRIVQRLAPAPPPCTLVATADTLGRVFVQDARDLCVLRVYKGYREAQIAWLPDNDHPSVPRLVLYAPRLGVLELHAPLVEKSRVAFRMPPGCVLVQTEQYRVCCITADGRVLELLPAADGQTTLSAQESHEEEVQSQPTDEVRKKLLETSSPDYEHVGSFVEAVKSGQTSRAVECLQRVESDSFKIAHLMATLLTCTSYTRSEVHIALASKAAQLTTALRASDLTARFEAHGRLAEAFALLATDNLLVDPLDRQSTPYGSILESAIGADLAAFALAETKRKQQSDASQRSAEDELVNCERFIMAHALEPMSDLRSRLDYELCPHPDLSESEQIWLAKAYFCRLLEENSVELPTAGREHPITHDVFMALSSFIGLPHVELAHHFAIFFLRTPLIHLLHTSDVTYASPLLCALVRLRASAAHSVDSIFVEICENSTEVGNALLLIRLCMEQEKGALNDNSIFSETLDKLYEALLFRMLIVESDVPAEVYEKYTANQSTGVPGDAERYALRCLIEVENYTQASSILSGLQGSRQPRSLKWHERATVSETVLEACRKKAIKYMTDNSATVIPERVLEWIKSADSDGKQVIGSSEDEQVREEKLRDIRSVLLNAHPYLPDSSVDAVRCLQLAEAMSALLELARNRVQIDPIVNIVSDETEQEDANKADQSYNNESTGRRVDPAVEVSNNSIVEDEGPLAREAK